MSDILDDIGERINKPIKVSTDAASFEMASIPDQIALAKEILRKNAGTKNKLGIRYRKAIPPGMVTGTNADTDCNC